MWNVQSEWWEIRLPYWLIRESRPWRTCRNCDFGRSPWWPGSDPAHMHGIACFGSVFYSIFTQPMYWAPNTLIFAAIKSTRQRQPTRTGIPKASVPPTKRGKKTRRPGSNVQGAPGDLSFCWILGGKKGTVEVIVISFTCAMAAMRLWFGERLFGVCYNSSSIASELDQKWPRRLALWWSLSDSVTWLTQWLMLGSARIVGILVSNCPWDRPPENTTLRRRCN